MSITDELREYVRHYSVAGSTKDKLLTAIADHIDAEHRKVEDEWRAKNGDMWLKGYAACHEELMEGHPVIVEDLEKAGWVKLPVDSDGVPIHIGDKVTLYGRCVYEVDAIYLHKDRVSVSYSGESGCGCDSADNFHHYHPDTWERIIEDATALGAQMGRRTTQVDDLVARCKALAGDAE